MPTFPTPCKIVCVVIITAAALMLGGCRVSTKATMPGQNATPSAPTFSMRVTNTTSREESVSVAMNGQSVMNERIAPRGRTSTKSVRVGNGYHQVVISNARGQRHQVMLKGGRSQTLDIRVDAQRPSGFGVHVTD